MFTLVGKKLNMLVLASLSNMVIVAVATAVILPSVRVPVLSEQMTVVDPRVSTAIKRRMRALCGVEQIY